MKKAPLSVLENLEEAIKTPGRTKKLARPGVSLLMVFWVVSRGQKQRYIEHELL